MKTMKPKRARLSDVVVKEVSLCDEGANPYSKICFFKRDFESLIDAAGERHKARIERAMIEATSRRQFDKRLAKSRAKFDGDVAAIMEGLAPPTADAGQNPPPSTAEPGLIEREAAATARERSGRPAYAEPTPDSGIAGRGDDGSAAEASPLEEQMGRMQARAGAKFPDEDPAVAFERAMWAMSAQREGNRWYGNCSPRRSSSEV
jgi:hypothetical protein